MLSGQVTLITVEVAKPTIFVFGKTAQTYYSFSALIQRVLLSAFLTRAVVEIDLVENSNEIKRVHPFDPGNPAPGPAAPDRVTRTATQRNQDGYDHLEVFLVRGQSAERQFNVIDPLLQQLLTTAFDATRSGQGPALEVTLSDQGEIEAARLGRVQ